MIPLSSLRTIRYDDYYRGELPINNSSAAQWLTVGSLAVLNFGPTDILATVSGTVVIPATPESLTCDSEGNLKSDGRWTYDWDGENRLVAMTARSGVGPQQRLEFAYDWQSRRISMLNSNTIYHGFSARRFIYDGWNVAASFSPAASLALFQAFVWGLDVSGSPRGAGGVGGLLWVSDQSTINNVPSSHFVAFDGSGNVSALIDAIDGTPSGQYEYGPFGEPIRDSGSMAKANPFRFSTKCQDDETVSFIMVTGFTTRGPEGG
jgi:hypothetical protein